ncbi:MAG: sulfotransferase, partial [Acidiferrobacterales bacterium]|nr:sulfotransferase [Acidiferrobacterales bacterium]
IINELLKVPNSDCLALAYEDFIEEPELLLQKICEFLKLASSAAIQEELSRADGLALSKHTLDPPHNNKWEKNRALMSDILPEMVQFYHDQIEPAAKLNSFKVNS